MKFTETHEWVDETQEQAAVGITHYAQKELGEVVYVELPEVGREVKKGQEMAVLESTKAASDLYSPCSGTILEVNKKLSANPDLINKDPEGEGWILKIRLSNKQELDDLLDRTAYEKLVG
jgi:glycine cleavage system H protein